jgi:hypothetical protein
MKKDILLIATMCSCSLTAGVLAPGRAVATLPVGNDANRHFYMNQEWIWSAPEHSASVDSGADRASELRKSADRPKTTVTLTKQTLLSQENLAFTMPTHPPQGNLAFTMPTHPPQVNIAFTMPTHPPHTDLAFTMPTHPPKQEHFGTVLLS